MFYDNAINRPLEKKPTSLYKWAPEGLGAKPINGSFFAADGPEKNRYHLSRHNRNFLANTSSLSCEDDVNIRKIY